MISGSKHAFFDVVNVKEKFHLTWWMAEFGNVSLKIFLHLVREIAQTQAAHFIVPFDDHLGIFLRCVLAYPAVDLFVRRAGADELSEFHCVEAGKLPEVRPQTAGIKVVLAIDSE